MLACSVYVDLNPIRASQLFYFSSRYAVMIRLFSARSCAKDWPETWFTAPPGNPKACFRTEVLDPLAVAAPA